MKRLLLATAVLAAFTGSSAADTHGSLTGMVLIALYDEFCPNAGVTAETYKVLDAIAKQFSEAERIAARDDAMKMVKEHGTMTAFCTFGELKYKPVIENFNKNSRKILGD